MSLAHCPNCTPTCSFEPAPAVDANAPVGGEKAPAGGGNAPPPPAYVETPVMKKVDKGAGPAKLSDNYANSMAQEDIRLNDRDIGCKCTCIKKLPPPVA